MIEIYPTHTCFDDALDFFEAMTPAQLHEALDRYQVVHGIYFGKIDGGEPQRHAHAWVYDTQTQECIQAGIMDGKRVQLYMTVAEFRTHLTLERETFYTLKEAYNQNMIHNNYGPWDVEYIALCGDRMA